MAFVCAQGHFLHNLMTTCLEKCPQIPGPERSDTVWTLRKHRGKPNARKVKMWNLQHLQTRVGARCSRLTSQQKVKGLALHPTSTNSVFSEGGSARWGRVPSRFIRTPTPFQPHGVEARLGEKGNRYKSLPELYSLTTGAENVSHCQMESPPGPCHPWTYFQTLCVSFYNMTLTDFLPPQQMTAEEVEKRGSFIPEVHVTTG